MAFKVLIGITNTAMMIMTVKRTVDNLRPDE